jgi:hypothetical protein
VQGRAAAPSRRSLHTPERRLNGIIRTGSKRAAYHAPQHLENVMIRILYTLCIVGLIGGTAWAATGMQSERHKTGTHAGVFLLAALQR